jgi:ribosome-binding factor A
MSTRTEKLGDLLRDEIARLLLRDFRDPRLGFVTITGVEVSPDLRQAQVFVSVLGDAAARDASLEALRHGAGYIQKALFRNLRLRHAVSIRFAPDESLVRGARIEEVLKHLHEQGGAHAPEEDEEEKEEEEE